jgi:hypothetical protein
MIAWLTCVLDCSSAPVMEIPGWRWSRNLESLRHSLPMSSLVSVPGTSARGCRREFEHPRRSPYLVIGEAGERGVSQLAGDGLDLLDDRPSASHEDNDLARRSASSSLRSMSPTSPAHRAVGPPMSRQASGRPRDPSDAWAPAHARHRCRARGEGAEPFPKRPHAVCHGLISHGRLYMAGFTWQANRWDCI